MDEKEWDRIIKINSKLKPTKKYHFKYKPEKESDKKITDLIKEELYRKSEKDMGEFFYDPFSDIKNQKKLNILYKKEIKEKPLNCAKCFTEISRNFEKKKLKIDNRKCYSYYLKEFINIDINPMEIVNKKFNVLENYDEEINFVMNCRKCNEIIGFHNFNQNKNYLLRYLD